MKADFGNILQNLCQLLMNLIDDDSLQSMKWLPVVFFPISMGHEIAILNSLSLQCFDHADTQPTPIEGYNFSDFLVDQ